MNLRLQIYISIFFIGFWAHWNYNIAQTKLNGKTRIQEATDLLENPTNFQPILFHKLISSASKRHIQVSQKNDLELLKAYDKILNGDVNGFLGTMKPISSEKIKFNNPFLQHLHLQLLVKYYELQGNPYLSKHYGGLDVSYCKSKRKNRWISQSYKSLSHVYLTFNQRDSTLIYAQKAIQFAKRSDSELELSLSFHYESLVYFHFRNLEEAVGKELLALQLAEKIRNNYYQAIFNRQVAEYSLEAKNLKEAETYLRKSTIKTTALHSKLLTAQNAITFAAIQTELGLPQSSIDALQESILILEKSKDIGSLGRAWLILGVSFNASGKTLESLAAYEKALNYFEISKDVESMAQAYYNIGKTYYRIKNYNKSEQFISKSIQIRTLLGEGTKIHESYLVMSQIYAARNQKQKAYDYLLKYNDFLRSHSTSIDSKKIEDLTQTNTREKRERLIDFQGEKLERELKEKEILQLQSDRQLLGISIVVTVFFLTAIIVFFVIRQKNTLQEQKESEMAQTLLRSQMNPHFIFNALAVIQSYIYDNTPERTSQFLVNFSKLIRLILENSPKEFITIDTEKEILTKYLMTQKLRFEDRFNFDLKVDEDLIFKRALIPPMITQPFIENSIEHGQLNSVENGLITIEMQEKNAMLEIRIIDNGVGRTKASKIKRNKSHRSMAMEITRQRIEILNKKYKGKGSLVVSDLDTKEKSGTKVIICLPIIYENTIFGNDEKSTNNR